MWPSKHPVSRYFRRAQVLPGGISRLLMVDPYPIYAKSGKVHTLKMYGIKRMDLMNNFASLIHGTRIRKLSRPSTL